MNFPKNFLWGASSSAFQCEGAYLENGRTLSVADIRSMKASKQLNIADTSVTVDFYHHYKEDIQLMKECGFTSFRLSISWSRLIPDGVHEYNKQAAQFYNDVLDELIHNGIAPIVTLYHFDLPQVLIEKYNGFASRQCIDDFVHYAKTCFELFGNKVQYWLTINEQMVLTHLPHFQGLKTLQESFQAHHHMCIANALVIKLYKSMHLNGMIGPCISYTTRLPATVNSKDSMIAYQQDALHVFSLVDVHVYGKYPKYFINELKKKGLMFKVEDGDEALLANAKPDFLGLNWYVTEAIGQYIDENESFGTYSGPEMPRQNRAVKGEYQYYRNPYTKYSEYNWNMDPVGLRFALRRIYDLYRLPVMITENGWSANETLDKDGHIHDTERIEYFQGMVEQMNLALEDGVELIGFNPWCFTDLLSASQGMDKRYGLVYIDRDNHDLRNLTRIPKDSYYWYQKTIKKCKAEAK